MRWPGVVCGSMLVYATDLVIPHLSLWPCSTKGDLEDIMVRCVEEVFKTPPSHYPALT